MENDLRLRERVRLLSDDSLLDMVESHAGDYTKDALEIIHDEIVRRGGIESVRLNAEKLRKEQEAGAGPSVGSAQRVALLRRFYPVLVIAAYGSFMYVIQASLWFYWLFLFILIAWLFTSLLRPPFKPEDEIKELLSKAASDANLPSPDSAPPADSEMRQIQG